MGTEPEMITVRLDDCDPPITGDLQVAGGPRTSFTGWIELLAQLERAIEETSRGERRLDDSADTK